MLTFTRQHSPVPSQQLCGIEAHSHPIRPERESKTISEPCTGSLISHGGVERPTYRMHKDAIAGHPSVTWQRMARLLDHSSIVAVQVPTYPMAYWGRGDIG